MLELGWSWVGVWLEFNLSWVVVMFELILMFVLFFLLDFNFVYTLVFLHILHISQI